MQAPRLGTLGPQASMYRMFCTWGHDGASGAHSKFAHEDAVHEGLQAPAFAHVIRMHSASYIGADVGPFLGTTSGRACTAHSSPAGPAHGVQCIVACRFCINLGGLEGGIPALTRCVLLSPLARYAA